MPIAPEIKDTRLAKIAIARGILWFVWASLLFGAVLFAAAQALVLSNPPPASLPPTRPPPVFPLLIANIVAGIFVVAIAHALRLCFIRMAVESQSPGMLLGVYIGGKVICWLACGLCILFALAFTMLANSFMPELPVAIVGWTLIAVDPPLFLPFRKLTLSG